MVTIMFWVFVRIVVSGTRTVGRVRDLELIAAFCASLAEERGSTLWRCRLFYVGLGMSDPD
jgi:hypothetical protein